MEEKLDHIKEWEKLSKLYESKAKTKSNRDMYFYRHQCIEGLLSGITTGYN